MSIIRESSASENNETIEIRLKINPYFITLIFPDFEDLLKMLGNI